MKLTENTKVRIKVPKHMYEAIQAELAKKSEMEEMAIHHDGHNKMEEDATSAVTTGAELTANKMADLVNIDPIFLGMAVVGAIAGATLKGPEIVDTVKTSLQVALDKGQDAYNKLKSYFKSKKIDTPEVGAKAEPVAEDYQEEVEEAIEYEALMEAVKDIAKKKAEAKKKKEAEDKKKADEKKKKEAEAKKKADAKKK